MGRPLGNTRRSPPKPSRTPARRLPREAKIALRVALPFGALAALLLSWDHLFAVPPDQLVEVAWKHECTCAHGWMKSLRAAGYTVRDHELDDTSAMRRQWRVPDAIRGCHPASYLGYFLDGHISAETLQRLARERPQAIGIQQVDTTKPDEGGIPQVVGSQLLLIRSGGVATPWHDGRKADAPQ